MEKLEKNTQNYKPFLRWAGGKRWLIKYINDLLPQNFNNYHEPFLGGASIFIHLKSSSKIKGYSFLSDYNEELITTYSQVQNNIEILLENLKAFENNVDYYYKIRSKKPKNDIETASRFIYLNKTSYNGIYRVNLKGEYNVPYGHRTSNDLYDFNNLKNLNTLFKEKTSFFSGDFDILRHNISENDLVFLDPPYTVAHENNGFIQYNQSIFSWKDQNRLAELLEFITKSNAYFIMTNAAHFSIDELFGNKGRKIILSRHSTIGGIGANRQSVNEYIYTNIPKIM